MGKRGRKRKRSAGFLAERKLWKELYRLLREDPEHWPARLTPETTEMLADYFEGLHEERLREAEGSQLAHYDEGAVTFHQPVWQLKRRKR